MKNLKKVTFIFLLHLINFTHSIDMPDNQEKQIVIVIPSYKNKDWYKRNLDSVLQQNYSNFYVIYTDDCSPDNTGDLVEAYLMEHDHEKRVQLIKNNTRVGALHNLYTMIHSCDDNAIVATLDGDDWFPDEHTLKRLNDVYCSEDVWLTYGQFELYPSGTKGWASAMPDYIVKANAFRDFQHLPTHLRTFYAWLFKKIKLEDLLYLGDFYTMTWDMAMMFPMIEMAGERHKFISDVMYIYNDANAISDHRISRQLQAHLAQIIKTKQRYHRLKIKPTSAKKTSTAQTDVIIFFNKNAEQLEQLLNSLEKYVHHINKQFVLYQPPILSEKDTFNTVIEKYPHINFYYIDEHRSNFRTTFDNVYKQASSPFTLFTKSNTLFTTHVDLNECISALTSTHAYAFYFNLSDNNNTIVQTKMPLIGITNTIVAWNFALARDAWSCANSFDTVLHRKTDTISAVMHEYFEPSAEGFEIVWANEGKLDRVGLCYKENHVQKITN